LHLHDAVFVAQALQLIADGSTDPGAVLLSAPSPLRPALRFKLPFERAATREPTPSTHARLESRPAGDVQAGDERVVRQADRRTLLRGVDGVSRNELQVARLRGSMAARFLSHSRPLPHMKARMLAYLGSGDSAPNCTSMMRSSWPKRFN
jgi:hypothetical protein